MKTVSRNLFASLCLSSLISANLYADPDPYGPQTSESLQNLVHYFLNLGSYLGYDLTQSAGQKGNAPTQQLLNPSAIQAVQVSLFDTFLGASPVDAISSALMQFVPNNMNSAYSMINSLANATFNNPAYNSASSQQQGTVTANSIIDQASLQPDPVSQAVLNILGTPDATYCMDYTGTNWNDNCKFLYQGLVMSNVLGKLPGTFQYFTYQYNQPILSQLNSNTLLSPLLYTTNTGGNSTSSSQPTANGLPAQTQAQQAANFIRYATGQVLPVPLPKLKDYDTLYTQAANLSKDVPEATQKQAQTSLTSYLMNIRVYAAQTSVAISNFYYLLSKRMPQNLPGNQVGSQALSEFTMATWRLFSPDQKSANTQWVNQINQASPATVQKEMVMLLAEINYQLYLNRQQEERLLLTNSILLLQNAKVTQPLASAITTGPVQ